MFFFHKGGQQVHFESCFTICALLGIVQCSLSVIPPAFCLGSSLAGSSFGLRNGEPRELQQLLENSSTPWLSIWQLEDSKCLCSWKSWKKMEHNSTTFGPLDFHCRRKYQESNHKSTINLTLPESACRWQRLWRAWHQHTSEQWWCALLRRLDEHAARSIQKLWILVKTRSGYSGTS